MTVLEIYIILPLLILHPYRLSIHSLGFSVVVVGHIIIVLLSPRAKL